MSRARPCRTTIILALLAMPPATLPARAGNERVIKVSTVEQLYRAVNDPANAGATLELKPGTYVLTADGPDGLPRPNGGRLELQKDMSIRGRAGDRTAVTIDAWNLPATSFPQNVNGLNLGPNAAVRLGRGRNTLSWLTVRDARFAQANIDSGLQPLDPGAAHVRLEHVASSGSTRGANLLNFGPLASGQVLVAEILDCYFFDNTFNLSEGIRIGNFQGATNARVYARMVGNSSWGQFQGRLIVNNRAISSEVHVLSVGNAFFDNGAGTIIVGGLSSNDTRADGNTIHFVSRNDFFGRNNGDTDFDRGGLVVLGTEDISDAGGGSFNTVNVTVSGAKMRDNQLADLAVIGARALSAATISNSLGNHVTVHLPDGHNPQVRNWVELIADSVPVASGTGNKVTVIRGGHDHGAHGQGGKGQNGKGQNGKGQNGKGQPGHGAGGHGVGGHGH